MSKIFNLLDTSQNGNISISEEGLNFLKLSEQETKIISIISSASGAENGNNMQKVRNSLISELVGVPVSDYKYEGAVLYSSNLKKENNKGNIYFINVKRCNKHLLAVTFLASSLIIFVVNEDLTDDEFSKFEELTKITGTIETKNKKNRENIFTESSPKCIFYVHNSKVPLDVYPKDYLDTKLRTKGKVEVDLIKDAFLRFFFDRDCVFDNQGQASEVLKSKIIHELNPKTIRGKLFTGISLGFFLEKFVNKQNEQGNADFEEVWTDLIMKDLSLYSEKAIEVFNENIYNVCKGEIKDHEHICENIWEGKIDAMKKFYEIFEVNLDTFNNPEYRIWFDQSKSDLEQKLEEIGEAKIEEINQENDEHCLNVLNEEFKFIEDKINRKIYNDENTEEFINDYQNFINSYQNQGRGYNKIKIMVDFLNEHRPKYYKYIINMMSEENKIKLEAANEKLNRFHKQKEENEEQYKELSEKNEEISKEINDLDSEIKKKKREFSNLGQELEKIEAEIKKIEEENLL